MSLIGNHDNPGAHRHHHEASDREIEKCVRDPRARVYECGPLECSFIVSRANKTIVRAGIMGGDVWDIKGGWVYGTDIDRQIEESEIAVLCQGVSRTTKED